MWDLSGHVSRRSVLATTGVLFAGIGAARVTRKSKNSETAMSPGSSTGNRLLVENPTNRPQRFTLSVSKHPISAFIITNRRGETETVRNADDGLQLASVVQTEATRIKPKTGVVFNRGYTVEANSAHLFRLRGIPERGQLLYTLKPKSAQETTFVSTWGTMGCSSRFDIYLSPSTSQSSCGSRLSEFDHVDATKEHTITI